jgi:hypothetical protein
MRAGGDHLGGLGGIRLFHETRQHMHTGQAGQFGACLDIAVAGLGRGRAHAEGDDAAVTGCGHRGGEGGVQRCGVGDRGIGRHHPQHRVGIGLGDQKGGGGDRGGGVAAHRLQQDARMGLAHQAKLLGHHEAMRLVADHDGVVEALAHGARRGFLDQAALGGQRPELLGEAFA